MLSVFAVFVVNRLFQGVVLYVLLRAWAKLYVQARELAGADHVRNELSIAKRRN